MSSGADITTERRPHDAEASRQALLAAARAVFDERGYERATTREIGERAGVDPALIARYFDRKEGLFLAALAAPDPGDEEIDYEPRALLELMLGRWEEHGHSPISRALASPALSEDVRDKVSEVVRERLLKRQAALLRERGVPDPELRAELLVALAVGVAMTRANGALEALAGSSRGQVLAALGPFVDSLAEAGEAR